MSHGVTGLTCSGTGHRDKAISAHKAPLPLPPNNQSSLLILLIIILCVTFFFQGSGGPECEFLAAITLDNHVTLESAVVPGSHIGVLPSGQLTNPAYTNKSTDASHFFVRFMVSVS